MKYLVIRLIMSIPVVLIGITTVCMYHNVIATEDGNSEQAITAMLSATGQYHSASQFMRIYGITNVFMPSRLQSHWVAAEFISAENSCMQLMHMAILRQEAISHINERNVYVKKLKSLETDYWQARIELAHKYLENLGDLVTSRVEEVDSCPSGVLPKSSQTSRSGRTDGEASHSSSDPRQLTGTGNGSDDGSD